MFGQLRSGLPHKQYLCGAVFAVAALSNPAQALAVESVAQNEASSTLTPLNRDLSVGELQAIGAEAVLALEKVLGKPIGPLDFQFAEREEIEQALLFSRRHIKNSIARDVSKTVFAKYFCGRSEVLVNLENLFKFESEFGLSGVASHQVLTVALIHEAAHAADDQEFNLLSLVEKCDNLTELNATLAVVEGHAQFVARRVCESIGLEEAFSLFSQTRACFAAVAEGWKGSDAVLPFFMAWLDFWHRDGEEFIADVYDAGGAEGLRQAFSNPPREMLLVSNPGWYLSPGTRPVLLATLRKRFDSFVDGLSATGVKPYTRINFLPSQLLDIYLADGVPESEAEPVFDEVLFHRMALFNAESSSLSASVYVLSSPSAGDALFSLWGKSSRLKDEGTVEMLGAVYQPIRAGECIGEARVGDYTGLFVQKDFRFATGTETAAGVFVAAKGQVFVEIAGSKHGVALPPEVLIPMANALLDPLASLR